MIDEEQIRQLCDQIIRRPHYGGIASDRHAALTKIEQLIGPPATEYTRSLRRLLEKKRVRDLTQHSSCVYEQAYRIRGIAGLINQWKIERREREAKFKVDVPEPTWWPETGDLILVARVYVKERAYKHIRCVVSAADIDSMPNSSKSLSKRQARSRRLGQWVRIHCAAFRIHIERLWEDGNDLCSVEVINYRETKSY